MLLVPHAEALALPIEVERATQKPTPNMPLASIGKYTYPTLSIYRCFILDFDVEFARFQRVKNKAPINAFSYVQLSFPNTYH